MQKYYKNIGPQVGQKKFLKKSIQPQNTYSQEYVSQSSKNLYKQVQTLNYDTQFETVFNEISINPFFNAITKHEKIRINKWLTKLSNISVNEVWKKNRNNYIKLIRLMFDCEVIIAPFNTMPPERDLHKLTNHQINVIINQVERLISERDDLKSKHKYSGRNPCNKGQTVIWTQESAYIDHRKSQSSYGGKQECPTYQHSSVTALALSQIPKYPKKQLKYNQNTSQKPREFEKNNRRSSLERHSNNQENSSQDYFNRKQRFKTFQTEDLGQEYLLMKNSIDQEESGEQRKNNAVEILKKGFGLLSQLPKTNKDQEINLLVQLIQNSNLIGQQLSQGQVSLNQQKQSINKQLIDQSQLGLKQINKNTLNIVENFEIKQKCFSTTELKSKGSDKDKKKMKLTLLSNPVSLMRA